MAMKSLEQTRRVGADHLLHHEGRIGAEHDHLAMGHVDHAHLAERDGKADGGKEQDRAEADAVGDVLHEGPEREPLFDGPDARRGNRAQRFRRVGGGERRSRRVLVSAARELEDGGDALGLRRVGLQQDDGGAGRFQSRGLVCPSRARRTRRWRLGCVAGFENRESGGRASPDPVPEGSRSRGPPRRRRTLLRRPPA